MAKYRIIKNNNKKLFVEVEKLKTAITLYKEGTKAGYIMEIKEQKNNRWYHVNID